MMLLNGDVKKVQMLYKKLMKMIDLDMKRQNAVMKQTLNLDVNVMKIGNLLCIKIIGEYLKDILKYIFQINILKYIFQINFLKEYF